ncbi:MAG: 4-hydroxy-tetrahydrodipicolinate reductase [Clostridia bacterium]|nr:4-hydroxy-tetrahydrodipicolinate reductase [Clostridia bacterium]
MTRIILVGCNGHMGQTVTRVLDNYPDCAIIAGIDSNTKMLNPYPVFDSFSDIKVDADVLIDFSTPELLKSLLCFASQKKLPCVIATTGYSEQEIGLIQDYAKDIPIFFSFNMSLGVNLLCSLAKQAAKILGDGFDIEIVEKHHNQKVDAPSGTAIMLADAVNDGAKEYVYDRHAKREKRKPNEIGMHSIRGGTIVGEHEVIFAGNDEVITLAHSAASKSVFANGAVNAAKYLVGKPPRIYDMTDLVNE